MTGAAEETRNGEAPLSWTVDVAILTEPLLLTGYLKAIAIACAIMGSLLTFLALVSGNADAVPAMWLMTGIAAGVFVVAGVLGVLVVLRNRLRLRYVVDDRGVEQVIDDSRARFAAGAARVAGLLAGKPGIAGAGMIAGADARRTAAWSGVVSASYHPQRHAVALANSWRTVLIVFCRPETYDAVADRVGRALAARRMPARARPGPLPGLFLRTLLAVVACLPFFLLPWPFRLDLFAPLFTLCFALAAVWLVPHLGLAALGGLAWMWVEIGILAAAERRSSIDGSLYRTIDHLGLDEAAPLAVALGASVLLAVLLIGLMRGRYATALAGDEEELELPPRRRRRDPPATRARPPSEEPASRPRARPSADDCAPSRASDESRRDSG